MQPATQVELIIVEVVMLIYFNIIIIKLDKFERKINMAQIAITKKIDSKE